MDIQSFIERAMLQFLPRLAFYAFQTQRPFLFGGFPARRSARAAPLVVEG
jgi:hypothetical protein